jgi:2-methylcitrate dehydratase PrpD
MPVPKIAELLAARAHLPLEARDADALRTLTLTNIAAGVGELGAVTELLRALPLDVTTRRTDAAFLLAAQLHARTQDDFYPEGRVHVGAITLAVTLALAERVQDRTLECLAAGYRVLCAVAEAHSAEAQRRGMRPSGVFGPFGAAACAAIALGLDQAQTANAIALAAAACAGHNQAWIAGSDEWLLEVGAAARAGLEAALFTRAGARAASDAFEGRYGWASALFDEPGAMTLASSLEASVLGPQVVAIKPYPVSGIAQVPTSLACALHDEVAGEPIEDIRVHISPIEHAYPGSANRGPFVSRSSALMSVAFCVACGISDGAVRLERLEHPGTPDLAGLLDRVRVEPDEAIPENEARVEVRFASGKEEQRAGRASEILFPPWAELCADGDGLARRSEADPRLVTTVRAELAKPAPRATELRRLLEGES